MRAIATRADTNPARIVAPNLIPEVIGAELPLPFIRPPTTWKLPGSRAPWRFIASPYGCRLGAARHRPQQPIIASRHKLCGGTVSFGTTLHEKARILLLTGARPRPKMPIGLPKD